MPFEHWRRGWTETKITERSCWHWRWVGAGWNASQGRTLFFCHFPFPGTLLNVHTICFNSQCSALFFSPIASSLPWGELLEALHSIFLTQLISAFFLGSYSSQVLTEESSSSPNGSVSSLGLSLLISSPCVLLFLHSNTTVVGISASEDDELAIFSAS